MLEHEVFQPFDEAPQAATPPVAAREHSDCMKQFAREAGLTVADAQARLDECVRMTRRLGDLLMTLRLHTAPPDAGERAPTHRSP